MKGFLWTQAPTPFAPRDNVDAVVYDAGDASAFARRLDAALAAPALRARVARSGLDRALRHHRAVSRVDWLLRSALTQSPARNGTPGRPGSDDGELAPALLAKALLRPPRTGRATEPAQPTAARLAELRDATFRHPDGRVSRGAAARRAAAAFATAGV